jgi:hypothetical protein
MNDHRSSKIQRQVAKQGLLLLERKLIHCRSRLCRAGSLQPGDSLIPTRLRNRIPKLLSNW